MYETAAELARELGVDKTTPIRWIRQGKIKARKHKHKTHYKIYENQIKLCKPKPYPKFSKNWSIAEENLIRYEYEKIGAEKIAKIIGRSVNSVRLHKHFMKKKGLL